ncbi:MAG: T9SS type A sorting domain-containing protein, partial [bacterium]
PHPVKTPPKAPQTDYSEDIIRISSEFYIPNGGTITGSLIYELSEGDYSLSYEYFMGTGSGGFKVASENVAKISALEFGGSDGNFNIGIKNYGSNKFNGQLNFETPFYQTRTALSLEVSENGTYTFILGTQSLLTETYTAKAVILYDGNMIDKKEIVFSLEPEFEIQRTEVSGQISAGSEGTVTVAICNVGNAVGEAKVKVKLLDIVDEERVLWLAPEEIGIMTFRLQVPTDFENGTYTGVASSQWSVVSEEREVAEEFLVRIVGIRLNVETSMDKGYYEEDEMATLTIGVTNLSDVAIGTLNLSAKVRFNSYEATQTFSLEPSTSTQLIFQIPIHHNGQKLNFGIYSENERAIWLDAIYVREKGSMTIISDKQVYNQGETVTLTIISQEQGTVSLSTPGEPATWTIEFNQPGSQTFTFKLPSPMLTGTYYLYYYSLLSTFYSLLPLDVRGISGVIKEVRFDKEGYSFNEGFKVKVGVEITEGFEGMIKAWVLEEKNNLTKICEKDIIFGKGRDTYEITGTTTTSNKQTLVYGIYIGTQTLVASGRKEIGIYNIFKGIPNVIAKEGLRVEITAETLNNQNALFDFYRVTQYPSPPAGIEPVKVWEFVIYTPGIEINKLMKVSYAYELEQLHKDIIEGSLKAYYVEDGEWKEIENQKLDMVNKELVFYVPHLSLVGIGGEVVKPLGEVIVYPNPAREQVTFGDNLPGQIKVRIFNIVGEEVYEYEGVSSSGKWLWKLQNKDNEKVAGGIYIYVISSSEGDKKVGKIGVVR